VIAQGQILPAGGILQLAATPGDVVQEIHVDRLGARVAAGAELAVMRSAAVRQREIEACKAQLRAAEQQKTQGIQQAKSSLAIAKAKRDSIQSQIDSLPRKKELLELAEQQVQAAQAMLEKLERISGDNRTQGFIGGLEVDRQRMEVREARLKFAEQRETYLQAEQDLGLALQSAVLEIQVAEEAYQQAMHNSAPEVIEAQLEALKEQLKLSRICAPSDGTVLAVHTQPGEAIGRLPLMEMADLSELVCEVEVNERDAARVAKGQSAVIRSFAFEEILEGQVSEIHGLVGEPMLRPQDPLARSDYHTRTVVIRLSDSEIAKNWLQLQVQVEIFTASNSAAEAGNVTDQVADDS
jgi:HlyD family secretion protein